MSALSAKWHSLYQLREKKNAYPSLQKENLIVWRKKKKNRDIYVIVFIFKIISTKNQCVLEMSL